MKHPKIALISLVLLSFAVLFTSGCTERDITQDTIEGYIFDIEVERVLVAYDINAKKFKQIENKSLEDLSNNEEYIPLIYLRYNDTNHLKIGDKVSVRIDDGVDDSYPQQATAKKIEIMN